MAVTISEMHVDVQETPPEASAPAKPGDDAKKEINLNQALDILRERDLRLRAD